MRRSVILVAVFAIAACTQVSAVPPSRQVLANLPLDSLIKSLGPEFAAKGIAVSSGQNHIM